MTLPRGYVVSAPLREGFKTYLEAVRRSPATVGVYRCGASVTAGVWGNRYR